MNVQKLVASLFAKNEAAEREIEKIIPLTGAVQRMKYVGTN